MASSRSNPNRESKLIMTTIFEHWICQKGVPSTIVSDQGRELISRGVKSLCTRVGIRKIQTSGYNPTGNASVERFHRFLMASLSILHKKTLVEWDELLPSVLFAYRASQNDTTGYSPFFLETGRRPTLPLGCLVGNFDQQNTTDDAEWVTRLKKSLEAAFANVRTSQIEVARKNKERSTRNSFNPVFHPGDLLYFWERAAQESRLREDIGGVTGQRKQAPTKLVNPRTGPYPCVRLDGA